MYIHLDTCTKIHLGIGFDPILDIAFKLQSLNRRFKGWTTIRTLSKERLNLLP